MPVVKIETENGVQTIESRYRGWRNNGVMRSAFRGMYKARREAAEAARKVAEDLAKKESEMFNFGKTVLKGHVFKVGDLQPMQTGGQFCSFSIAAIREYGGKTYTDKYQIAAFGDVAEEAAKSLGKDVIVFASLRSREAQGKNGVFYNAELRAEEIQFLATLIDGDFNEDAPF